MAAGKYEFDAVIRKHGSLDAGFVEFPYDAGKEFRGRKRVKIRALIDDCLYRGSLVRMGAECHWIGITQEIRRKTGKNPGDSVHVVIEEDKEERIVEVPADLLDLMAKEDGMVEFFNSLSFTHRKEYVKWIVEAKREETRRTRLIKAIEMLKAKRKTPF